MVSSLIVFVLSQRFDVYVINDIVGPLSFPDPSGEQSTIPKPFF
jgi:hypothetical protein